MAISYPLSMPNAPGFQKQNLSAVNVVGIAVSPFTKQQQTYEWPAEYWHLDIALPPMSRTLAEAWVTFLVSLRGYVGTFHAGDGAVKAPQGVATGTPVVNGAQSAAGVTLNTKGWTHSVTGILKAGDYIQLGTGTQQRVYKVLTDANSDSSGNATLDIFPRLREGVSDGQPITLTNCQGTFRLAFETPGSGSASGAGNARTWSVDEAMVYGITFQAQEAL